jgi:phosphate-selective porin OprO/OprP
MKALVLVLALAQEPPKEGPPKTQELPKADFEAGYDGGFYVKGKNAKLAVEGLLQVNGVFFEQDAAHESEFVLRRMRLEFTGEFFDRWYFHIEPKFVSDGAELEEAWLGLKVDTHLFMFGRMKEPFSFEEMASQRHMDMINFSILNQFVPAEDHGITVIGNFDILEYGAGFYNGTGSDDTTSDKDAALRLVLHAWRGLQFGGAVTVGRQEIDVSDEELRTEARVPWATFLPGTEIEDERVRLGAEAAFLEGPFAASAELIRIREEVNETTVDLVGGYVQASYVLTGEGKSWKGEGVRIWKGVKPERPFLKDADVGAWQLVARWSRLDVDRDLTPFVTNNPRRIDSFTFGVNWSANEFVKVKVNYVRTVYDENVVFAGKSRDHEDALIFQLQVMF